MCDLSFPNEIDLPNTKEQTSVVVDLVNETEDIIAFRIQTTAPKRYSVVPKRGVVRELASIPIQVTMSLSKDPKKNDKPDKFRVQTILLTSVPRDAEDNERYLDKVWKLAPADQIRTGIMLVRLEEAAPPKPSRNNSNRPRRTPLNVPARSDPEDDYEPEDKIPPRQSYMNDNSSDMLSDGENYYSDEEFDRYKEPLYDRVRSKKDYQDNNLDSESSDGEYPPLDPRDEEPPARAQRPLDLPEMRENTDKPPNTPALRESNTPALRESNIPSLRESNLPSLRESNTPALRESNTPSLRESNTPAPRESNNTNLQKK
jgi:hypothetical protein